MYERASEVAFRGDWPATGMMSGGGVLNPGFSVAVFAGLARISAGPVAMVRLVQVANVLALLLFVVFIYNWVPASEKRTWMYGISLAAVSPLAILFSRKIWAQDLLPLFTFFLIAANASRRRPAGAFLYGFITLLIGQLHLSGFFTAAGLLLFTLMHDAYHKTKVRIAWLAAGMAAGFIPLAPWLAELSRGESGTALTLAHVLQFRFYIYEFLEIHGLNLIYTFEKEFSSFLKFPLVAGQALYISLMLHVALAAAGVFSLMLCFRLGGRILDTIRQTGIMHYLLNCSVYRFYITGIFAGLGLLLSFSGTEIYPHYMIAAIPFSYIFLARVYQAHTALFKLIGIAQLLLSIIFLYYVHSNSGIANGDYGMTFHWQEFHQGR
jgi:hypothetical protein